MSIRNELLEQIRNLLAGGSTSLAVEYTQLGLFASTDTQDPPSDGSAGKITVSFGAGGDTAGGEFTIDPDGTVNCNQNSTQYTFKITLRPSRTGKPGNSIPMARFLYSANGTGSDTIQVNYTFSVRIDDSDSVWREEFEGTFSPAVGSKLWVEFAIDEAGANAGRLEADQPTGTLLTDTPPWDGVPSASISISKLSVVPS